MPPDAKKCPRCNVTEFKQGNCDAGFRTLRMRDALETVGLWPVAECLDQSVVSVQTKLKVSPTCLSHNFGKHYCPLLVVWDDLSVGAGRILQDVRGLDIDAIKAKE